MPNFVSCVKQKGENIAQSLLGQGFGQDLSGELYYKGQDSGAILPFAI